MESEEETIKHSVNLMAAYKAVQLVIPDTVKFYNGLISFHDKICTTIRSFM